MCPFFSWWKNIYSFIYSDVSISQQTSVRMKDTFLYLPYSHHFSLSKKIRKLGKMCVNKYIYIFFNENDKNFNLFFSLFSSDLRSTDVKKYIQILINIVTHLSFDFLCIHLNNETQWNRILFMNLLLILFNQKKPQQPLKLLNKINFHSIRSLFKMILFSIKC